MSAHVILGIALLAVIPVWFVLVIATRGRTRRRDERELLIAAGMSADTPHLRRHSDPDEV